MSGFMDNYVDVATRLKWAFEKYPDLRIQETHREVIEMPDKSCFIRCVVTIWRTADDQIPVVASACELYPGRTSFQRYSESECGFTSAVGRALAYAGFSGNKSLASLDEITSAKARHEPRHLAEVVPFPEEGPQKTYPSNKQLGMMRGLANGKGIQGDALKEYCCTVLGRTILSTNDLTKQDISKVIDALQITGEPV